jgi:hypothetical protein
MKKMSSRFIICAATLLAWAMLSAGIARGQAVDTMVITRNSSNSMTMIFNGISMDYTNTGFQWVIPVPGLTFQGPQMVGTNTWAQPGSTTLVNIVHGFGPSVQILTDTDPSIEFPIPPKIANGATDTTDFFIGSTPLYVTFNDNIQTVPEPSTFALLALGSLVFLGVLRRGRDTC